MAGIAEVLLNLGYSISGSDIRRNQLVDHLEGLGATVVLGHRAENLPVNTAVVVVSSAVNQSNPEVAEALHRHIPVIPRAEMLGELMRMKYGIAVAGSHGKTTTTSMTAKILLDGGLDPTVIIGGRVLSQLSGACVGTGQYLVAESDESDGSFLLLKPAIAVVTNIDREHLGHYGSFGALEESFAQFMGAVPFYGLVVACFDDPVVARLARGLKRRVVSYGLSPEHDIYATDVTIDGPSSSFTLFVEGKEVTRTTIPMLGSHMVSNSLAAIAVGIEVGLYPDEACAALSTFAGVARRSEVVYRDNGNVVIDDYAHHPRELVATLGGIRRGWLPTMARFAEEGAEGRLLVVFQPHRYSRTRELFSEFITSFGDADELIVTEVYSAGEEPIAGVDGKALAAAMQHPAVSFIPEITELIPELLKRVRPGDVVLMVGAGSITQVAHQFGNALRERSR